MLVSMATGHLHQRRPVPISAIRCEEMGWSTGSGGVAVADGLGTSPTGDSLAGMARGGRGFREERRRFCLAEKPVRLNSGSRHIRPNAAFRPMFIALATIKAVAPCSSNAFTSCRCSSVHFLCGGGGGVGVVCIGLPPCLRVLTVAVALDPVDVGAKVKLGQAGQFDDLVEPVEWHNLPFVNGLRRDAQGAASARKTANLFDSFLARHDPWVVSRIFEPCTHAPSQNTVQNGRQPAIVMLQRETTMRVKSVVFYRFKTIDRGPEQHAIVLNILAHANVCILKWRQV